MWGRVAGAVALFTAGAIAISGCDAYYVLCTGPDGEFDSDETFTLGGREVKCADLEVPAEELFIRIVSGQPVRAGQPVRFEAVSPASADFTIDWDVDDDDAFDDATGTQVEVAFEEPARRVTVRARGTDRFGDPHRSAVISFEVLPEDGGSGPVRPPGPRGGGGAPQSLSAGTSVRFGAGVTLGTFPSTRDVDDGPGGLRIRGAYGVGSVRGRLAGGERTERGSGSLEGFLSSSFLARYGASAGDDGRLTIRGVALAHFGAAPGAACLRFRLTGDEERPGRGTLRLLGGTGEAGALRGRARFRADLGPAGRTKLRGRISTRIEEPGQLPPACGRLATFSPL